MDINFNYNPLNEKMSQFHASPAVYKALIGGFGSGKTYAGVAEGIMLSMEFPGNVGAICRKTFGEIHRSTKLVFDELCPPAIVKKPYNQHDHTMVLINGSKIIFFPLDDAQKIRSLNAGWILVDEANEIPEEMATMLSLRKGRLMHIPRSAFLVASNPTETNHWLYNWFGKGDTPDKKCWMLSTYDNKDHLPPNYIKDLEASLTPDLFERYVLGQWGHVTFGERIYMGFSSKIHIGSTVYRPEFPVLRGWDFGYYHPAVVFAQLQKNDWVRVHAELMGKNVILEHFAEDVIRKSEELFPGAKFEDYGDPAGEKMDRSGISTDVPVRILRDKFGIHIRSRATLVKDGIDLIRRKLSQIVAGEPALVINPECKILAEGFSGAYACKKRTDGTILKDEPRDDGYYEHLQDCIRYIVVNKFALDMKSFDDRKKGLPVYRPSFLGTSW